MFKYFIELMFSIGMIVNAALFIPQALKLFKTKSSHGMSLMTFAGINTIQLFAVMHGYINSDMILMYGYMLSFITCGLVTYLIFFYKRKNINMRLYSFSLIVYIKYFIELVFGLGLFINATLFASQAIKLFKTKNPNNLSFVTFAGFNVKQIFSMLHGYIHDDLIFMYGIMLSFIACGAVTSLIFFYRKRNA